MAITAQEQDRLAGALKALVAPESRGDPQSPLRWTTKSTARLAEELTTRGHPVAARTVARLLTQAGYSPAGQRQDDRGQTAPGSGRPVPLHHRAGGGGPGGR